MATGAQVLEMLIPNGGWVIRGDTFEGVQFISATPITKTQFADGFAAFDALVISKAAAKAAEEVTFAKDRADGLAKLQAAAGLTLAQAEAVARKKP